MSLGPIVDVAIGLIFAFLLLGLVSSAAQEIVASAREWRGKMLEQALIRLLGDGDRATDLFRRVFGHGLIRSLSHRGRPSYIPAGTFTLALIDTVAQGNQAPAFTAVEQALSNLPHGTARESLIALTKDAAGDLDALKASIARWYDDAMDRLSGIYKRKSHCFAIVFGISAAIVLNVDSIEIANVLWSNDALRGNIAAMAQAYSATHTGQPAQSATTMNAARTDLSNALGTLQQLKLPIGWDGVVQQSGIPAVGHSQIGRLFLSIGKYFWLRGFGGSMLIVFGWLITGIAVSFGAPFWFDLLQNVVNLRSSGPQPKRADAKEATP